MKTSLLYIFSLLAFIPLHAQEFDYSFKESYDVSTPAQLDLTSFDGNLDVFSSDGNKIEVYYIAKKGGRLLKIDRQELEKELIVESDHDKNSLKISIRDKKRYQAINFELSINVHFKVFVPKETACRLTTSDGSISIAKLNSNQHCKTSDGSIEITEISGNVIGKTSDGDVHVKQVKGMVDVGTSDGSIQLRQIAGDVQASTSDGNIILDKVKGDIIVKTSDGYIDFKEISGSFKASTSDGNIHGNVADLKKELTLKTSGGNIEVTLPEALGLDLEIKGESIDAPFKNFTGKFDKKFVSGKSNGGGIPVVLSTSDGNVRLSY
ncbi:DUF4097 family beta strand repeat-containing protein [Chryseolinea sp. H1M3-3]|uniref:DUF4097 family beta strand repeat-containing protein n=1 Tax=Chryseolinea sp. H1M3-3 TaxID=3034144 RepID=UPI0023EC1BAA|nr:DUF4097 family beta strand repeat-containing protein [Chryseolinea sp. H1M3-3]